MLEYNGIKMELLNIDRFEREAVYSADGVDYLYNQYTIQMTAVVHPAYLDTGGGPFPTNDKIKEALMVPRRKFKLSFLTGGAAYLDSEIFGGLGPFEEVGPRPFTFVGPVSEELGRQDVVPYPMDIKAEGEAGETEILIESPLPGFAVDAKLGPEPLFCHITKFLGENGFVITWIIRTWLVDCPGNPVLLSALLDNRFDMVHDVDDDQLTTITTYGVVVFRTDRLGTLLPDSFRKFLLAPIWKGFRRQHIQVKQMSDTTIRYLTSDIQTPVVFDPVVDNAIKAEILHRRVLFQKENMASSLIGATSQYYNFRANKSFAQGQQKIERQRADELHAAAMQQHAANMQQHQAKMGNLNLKAQNARARQHQQIIKGGRP